MEKFYEVRYMNSVWGDLIDTNLNYEQAQAVVRDMEPGMHPEQLADVVIREVPEKVLDIGSVVWCLEEEVEATIIEVFEENGERSYALAQSKDQRERTGQIQWVAWLTEKDLEEVA